jgi:DNA-binding NarL/FixJ family response regulator
VDEYIFEALEKGASGFLLKDAEPDEILRAIRAAASGDAVLSPGVAKRLIADYARRPRRRELTAGALDALTDREREVMTLVARGLSNDEIAKRLWVSPLTAKTHVSRILSKLGARDRAQLIVLAYELGLVEPGDTL